MLHPEIAQFWLKALQGDRSVKFSDIHLREYPDLVGLTVAQVREKQNKLVVAIKRDKEYIYTPDLTMQLQADDLIITIGSTGPSAPAT